MARTRNPDRPIPAWAQSMTDQEIVEDFKRHLDSGRISYESLGSRTVDMRKRLYKILIDGLALQQTRT